MEIKIEIPDNAEWGVSALGFRPKTSEQYFKETELLAKQLFGQETNLTKGNTLGHLIDVNCQIAANLNNLLMAVLSQAFLDWLVGNSLDWFGEGRGVKRKPATQAQGTILITGDIDYTVPGGTIVVSTNGNRYSTISDATLINGSALVGIKSMEAGSHTGSIQNTIKELEDPNSMIFSIINNNIVISGEDIEIDDSYRGRIKSWLNITTGSTVDSIKSALLANDTVEYADVFENPTETQITVKGVPLDPGQILSIIFGNDMGSAAKTQFKNRPAGIPTNGDHTTTITTLSGQKIIERVREGTKVNTVVKIKATGLHPYFGENSRTEINRSILDYYQKRMAPGITLDWEKIRGKVEGHDDIVSENVIVTISSDNITFIQEDIELGIDEIATISEANILYEGF